MRLIPHPATSEPSVRSIDVAAQANGKRLVLRYRLAAVLENIRIPTPEVPQRRDGLWKHTCFELFVMRDNGPGYEEYNFSPSGAWAHYRFSDYRQAMPLDENIPAPGISVRQHNDCLELQTAVAMETKPVSIGLSAVIENTRRELSHWALNHPSETPDFHHAGAFNLKLE